MKTWTQHEYDAEARTSHGVVLGTGDFRRVDFKGRHALVIGAGSLIGDNAEMGVNCEIGARCDIGKGLILGANSRIGEHCHIGENAMIGEGCTIGRHSCLASGCGIAPGVELGENVHLPADCAYLFDYRAKHADGRTLIKCVPCYGEVNYAFAAGGDDEREIFCVSRGSCRTLEELEEYAADVACCSGMTGTYSDIEYGRRLLATAAYFRALFAAAGMCEMRRRRK